MVPLPVIPVVLIVLRLLMRSQGKGQPVTLPEPRRIFWVTVGVVLALFALPVGVALLVSLGDGVTLAKLAGLAGFGATTGAAVVFFASPWTLLHPIARRGHARLAYYAAQLTPLLAWSGETTAGGLLLASIALASRPSCTAEERRFVEKRLARDRRGLGAFGCAFALWHALEARAARDAGDRERAFDLEERARALFGTVTYMSPKAAPLPIRRVAEEYLALDSARRGLWGALDDLPEAPRRFWQRGVVTPAVAALRAYFRERLRGEAVAKEDRPAATSLDSPVLAELFAREGKKGDVKLPEAHERATAAYRALRDRRHVGPRATLAMLVTYDFLLHPESPGTVLPPEVKDDEELVRGVQEEVAGALAEAILPMGVPFEALRHYGPISARVRDRIETTLFDDLARDLRRLEAFHKEGTRRSTQEEWLDTSLVRVRYRRLQFMLGPAAAGRALQSVAYAYGNLGVDMTAKAPFRRPLAHAIFNVLRGEAERAGNQASITLQTNNMRATAGTR